MSKTVSIDSITIPDPEDDLGSVWASPSFWIAIIPVLSGVLTTFFGDDFGISGNAQVVGTAAASIAAGALVIARSISRRTLVEARTRRIDIAASLAMTKNLEIRDNEISRLTRMLSEAQGHRTAAQADTQAIQKTEPDVYNQTEQPVKAVRTRAPKKAEPGKVDMRTKEGRALKAEQEAAAAKRVAKRPARA